MTSSQNLNGYADFIAIVRKYQWAGLNLEESITRSVQDCIRQGVLVDFLNKHASEVINMLTAEFDINIAKEVWQEEAREEGREEASKEVREENAKEMLADNVPIVKIMKYTGLTREQIENIKF
jgi:predicted transposase/invertase (TIGR01784 family)